MPEGGFVAFGQGGLPGLEGAGQYLGQSDGGERKLNLPACRCFKKTSKTGGKLRVVLQEVDPRGCVDQHRAAFSQAAP